MRTEGRSRFAFTGETSVSFVVVHTVYVPDPPAERSGMAGSRLQVPFGCTEFDRGAEESQTEFDDLTARVEFDRGPEESQTEFDTYLTYLTEFDTYLTATLTRARGARPL